MAWWSLRERSVRAKCIGYDERGKEKQRAKQSNAEQSRVRFHVCTAWGGVRNGKNVGMSQSEEEIKGTYSKGEVKSD